ncbi:MAG: hypothetical protein K6F52_02910 [Clostridia bacterium]|nr:hypothetical protein [Clostridia bacterium]
MKYLICFVMVMCVIYFGTSGKRDRKSPITYKGSVKRISSEFFKGNLSARDAFEDIRGRALNKGIQEYYRKSYGKMCDFEDDEIIIESFFLLVLGDMRTHYNYVKGKNGKWKANYDDLYNGAHDYNMVITDRNIYFGNDLNQKKGRKAWKLPLKMIKDVEKTPDYTEISVTTPLRGKRVHNIWNSSGDVAYYLLKCMKDAGIFSVEEAAGCRKVTREKARQTVRKSA